jgi:hypothetical protein
MTNVRKKNFYSHEKKKRALNCEEFNHLFLNTSLKAHVLIETNVFMMINEKTPL